MIQILRDLERLVLPNACLSCDDLIECGNPDGLICGVCRSRMNGLSPGCKRCRHPLPPVGPCRFCARWPQALGHAHSAVWHQGPARVLVHHLKYNGYAHLAELAAQRIVRSISRPPRAAGLVPIPLTARRLRSRGYNQAALIARALGARWCIPVLDQFLRRRREATSQIELTPEERAANVDGAFVVSDRSASSPTWRPNAVKPPHYGGVIPGQGWTTATIILVDDVLTTGATIAAAASAVRRACDVPIAAVTFARALPFDLRALAE